MQETSLSAQFVIQNAGLSRVGADRIALLEAVRDHGSISAAGRALGLSYKAAWDGVAALNNLFPAPLVVARPGGRHGGGAELTAEGAEVIETFHLIQNELANAMEALRQRLEQGHFPAISRDFRSIFMRTSARNALRCTVDSVTAGPVNAEVQLHLADGIKLAVIITNASVQDLGLAPGAPVVALIKSSFVMLAREFGRISARNRIPGRVIKREDGAVNSEVVLDIGGGKTIAAIVTKESAEDMDLRVGETAWALIKASHVLLAVE